ncbi:hypothetical protein ACQPX6_16400 [Actinomycetospora sp. CA-101289]|uniref:hypothetical protein n=1 Tax=Actinomycetospora sp. CA-101289 TaxID=3239893 RepID=UPI003D99404F
MTAFGGIFRSPALEGVDDADDAGEGARVVGIDLDSGVVRLRAARRDHAEEPEAPSPPED